MWWWLTFKPEGHVLVNCHIETASVTHASFLHYCKCVYDAIAYAVFQEKQRFLTDVLHEVMLLDGLTSSHPVSQEVQQATDIDRVFDWIAYKKVGLIKPIYFYRNLSVAIRRLCSVCRTNAQEYIHNCY